MKSVADVGGFPVNHGRPRFFFASLRLCAFTIELGRTMEMLDESVEIEIKPDNEYADNDRIFSAGIAKRGIM